MTKGPVLKYILTRHCIICIHRKRFLSNHNMHLLLHCWLFVGHEKFFKKTSFTGSLYHFWGWFYNQGFVAMEIIVYEMVVMDIK